MFAKNSPRLSGVSALVKRGTMRSYLAAALLPLLIMAGLQTPGSSKTNTPASVIPFYYSIFNGNIVKRNSELGPLTGTLDNSLTARGPGDDFSAIVYRSSLDTYLAAPVIPFYYSIFNGSIVKRNSELGPLTGTLENSLTARGPGHDFGTIGG